MCLSQRDFQLHWKNSSKHMPSSHEMVTKPASWAARQGPYEACSSRNSDIPAEQGHNIGSLSLESIFLKQEGNERKAWGPASKTMTDILNKTITFPNDKRDHSFIILGNIWPSSQRRARNRGHYFDFLFTHILAHPPTHPHGIIKISSEFVIWRFPFGS